MEGREPGFLFDIGSMPKAVQVLIYLISAKSYLLSTGAYGV